MVETELKFQVPAAVRERLQRALATSTARSIALRALYFDTPDRRLARAGLALRLRKEGTHWVQTLKGHGASAMDRLEHELRLDATRGTPRLDTARHDGTPLAHALAAALGDAAAALTVAYETDVLRTLRLVRHQGALVEVAFDVGEIVAGANRMPVCELEFELKRGPVAALLGLVARWLPRHGLWLDVRSKAEQGDRLARGLHAGPAVQATAPKLKNDMSADAALRCIAGACLAQVLPNAADVAGGVGGPEHLHQLRVGLRRLRSALRVFGKLSAAVDTAWEPALAALFRALGAARDRDALAESLLPELQRAGAPMTELLPAPGEGDPSTALRAAPANQLMLDLIGFARGAPDAAQLQPAAPRPDLLLLVAPRLRRMRRQLKSDAAVFANGNDAQRHRARKRLKRLRYSLEFVAGLYAPKALKRCLAEVRAAQEALGRYNDLVVAEQAFRAQLEHDPRAWFAIGWLTAQRKRQVPQAAKALARVARAAKALPDS
ncbi:MAG: CYTH and CHAD domain-containing protein [Burkholderiales bacterium]|nr:CYTH and CHAD domain-containing protein [Burkholderiales bacterium]